MAQIKCKEAAVRMRKEYGENSCEECYDCCNRQRKNRMEKTKVCIAFSSDIPGMVRKERVGFSTFRFVESGRQNCR